MKINKIFRAIWVIAAVFLTALCLTACFGNKDKDGGSTDKTENIYDLKELGAECGVAAVDYDGTEKFVEILIRNNGRVVASIKQGENNDDLEAEFFDNINAGTATVKVRAKAGAEKFKGETQCTFTINRINAETDDFSKLKNYLSCGNYNNVKLTDRVEIPQGETLVIEKETRLTLDGYDLVSYGKIVNNGTISTVGNKYGTSGNLILNGETVHSGIIILVTGAKLVNKGAFINDGEIKLLGNGADLYTDEKISGSGTVADGINVHFRSALSAEGIQLSFDRADYTGKELKPSVVVVADEKTVPQTEYDIAYSDNVTAGTAKVTVIAKEASEYIRGEITVTFVIDKAAVTVKSEDDFFAALENANYCEVTADLNKINRSFTVPEGLRVVVKGELLGDVTVKGTLVAETNEEYSGIFAATRFNGKLVNNGKVEISGSAIVRSELSGSGEYVNNGKMFFNSDAAIADGATVVNKNKAYVDDAVDGITNVGAGAFIIREPIDGRINLSEGTFVYDGTVKTPYPVFDKGQIAAETYLISISYEGSTVNTSFPKNVGKLCYKVSFNEVSETYCGETTLFYEIKPATGLFSNSRAFFDAYESGNYNVLEADFRLVFDMPFTIREGVEIVVPAGQKAVVNSVLTVKGKITNNGEIADGAARMAISDGELVNNGVAYFNDAKPEGTTGSGAIYVRKDISEAIWKDFLTEVAYRADLSYNPPEPALEMPDGTALMRGAVNDFACSYENYRGVSIGGKKAKITVEAVTFSKNVYGSATREFAVTEGTVYVDNLDDLLTALNDVAATDVCNYKDIYLTADIEATNDGTTDIVLEIRKNTTLHIDGHDGYFNQGKRRKGYKIVNNGVIKAEKAKWYHGECSLSGNAVAVTVE